MRFVLMPLSLEQRALVKIAVTLWNQNDVRTLIAEFSFQCNSRITDDEWKEIEEKVTEKVAQLPLPQLLKHKVSCFINCVGFQILEWIKFHHIHCKLPLNLPAELCWTRQGTVDRKRTAEMLVKDESLDLSIRYMLACLYCLEDDVIALWNTLPEDLKQNSRYSLNIAEYNENWIIDFWSRTMKRRGLGHARTSYKDEFVLYALKGNKVVVEYFLQKLTPHEREASLVEAAKHATDSDTLYFLLSEMGEEQQMEVFKDNPRRVLRCFLQWPFQIFFIEIANCVWNFLPQDDYVLLLTDIIHKVGDGYKDWNYRKLFTEFWQKSPDALKGVNTNDLDHSLLLSYLFDIKDKENIQLILQDATRTAREKLIYSDEVHCFCQYSILNDEWDFLEFCIRECFPSKNEMLKFKEEFEKSEKLDYIEDNFVRNKDKWDRLFLSPDDSHREY